MQKKIVLTSAIAIFIGLVVGLNESKLTFADETEQTDYKYAEDITITAQVKFEDGISVIYPFEVFEQISGFDAEDPVMFFLERVVGNTPLLHEAADRAHKWSLNEQFYRGKYFDMDILIHENGNVLRHFSYSKCQIIDYTVKTLFDKEEAWMGKGFVLLDKFEFACRGYDPSSPVFEKLYNSYEKAKTTSSMDLKEPDITWEDFDRFKNSAK